MSVPTSTPVRPVPTRLGREQCPACRSFLPARKAAAVCPRCGQPIKTGAAPAGHRPGRPPERVRLAGYEAEIAWRIARDIRTRWPGCSIAEVWPCDIALIINKTLDHLVDLEQRRAAA